MGRMVGGGGGLLIGVAFQTEVKIIVLLQYGLVLWALVSLLCLFCIVPETLLCLPYTYLSSANRQSAYKRNNEKFADYRNVQYMVSGQICISWTTRSHFRKIRHISRLTKHLRICGLEKKMVKNPDGKPVAAQLSKENRLPPWLRRPRLESTVETLVQHKALFLQKNNEKSAPPQICRVRAARGTAVGNRRPWQGAVAGCRDRQGLHGVWRPTPVCGLKFPCHRWRMKCVF